MRAKLAKQLVRISARWWDASYSAWVRYKEGEVSEGYSNWWGNRAVSVDKTLIPLASRLDYEATGEEMCEHGWWG